MNQKNTVEMSIKSVMLQSHTASDGLPFSPGTGKPKPFELPTLHPFVVNTSLFYSIAYCLMSLPFDAKLYCYVYSTNLHSNIINIHIRCN